MNLRNALVRFFFSTKKQPLLRPPTGLADGFGRKGSSPYNHRSTVNERRLPTVVDLNVWCWWPIHPGGPPRDARQKLFGSPAPRRSLRDVMSSAASPCRIRRVQPGPGGIYGVGRCTPKTIHTSPRYVQILPIFHAP